MTESLPRSFGAYLLLERFARGGMGEVYVARHGELAGLEKICIIKKLRRDLAAPEHVARFLDEARVVLTLDHAHIAHVFDVGSVDDEYYLAMEYVAGRDLRTVLERCARDGRAVPVPVALKVLCDALEGLDAAHRRTDPRSGEPLHVVHRDVSPQNILVSFEGEVKLIDFGLALSRMKSEETEPNVVMGKMAYMAPEQARGDDVDATVDQFACAVVGYEMLAGERYYATLSSEDIWRRAGRGEHVARKWDAIDAPIAAVLRRALDADHKKRFPTSAAFAAALAHILHERYPSAGAADVRAWMRDVFATDVAEEREKMSRWGISALSSSSFALPNQTVASPASLATETDAHLHDRTVKDGETLVSASPPAMDVSASGARAERSHTELIRRGTPLTQRAPPAPATPVEMTPSFVDDVRAAGLSREKRAWQIAAALALCALIGAGWLLLVPHGIPKESLPAPTPTTTPVPTVPDAPLPATLPVETRAAPQPDVPRVVETKAPEPKPEVKTSPTTAPVATTKTPPPAAAACVMPSVGDLHDAALAVRVEMAKNPGCACVADEVGLRVEGVRSGNTTGADACAVAAKVKSCVRACIPEKQRAAMRWPQ